MLMMFVSVVPPDVDHAPSAYQVVEGNGAILFCNATGNPQPNITWTKQGNSSELSTSETLNLTKLMREDNGAVYQCAATNYIGTAQVTTKVTVWCEYWEEHGNCISTMVSITFFYIHVHCVFARARVIVFYVFRQYTLL